MSPEYLLFEIENIYAFLGKLDKKNKTLLFRLQFALLRFQLGSGCDPMDLRHIEMSF